MKKVILSVLFIIGTGSAQCEESFEGKTLDELLIMHESQKNAIEKTVEYKYAQCIQHEATVYARLLLKSIVHCSDERIANIFWPWANGDNCELMSVYEKMTDERTMALGNANDRLNELIARDYPTLRKLNLVILERQLAIVEKRRAFMLAKSGK